MVPHWHKSMAGTIISRRSKEKDSATGKVTETFEHLQYPYRSLGPLTLHVHPYFIIYNAGSKMKSGTMGKGYQFQSLVGQPGITSNAVADMMYSTVTDVFD